MRKIQFNSFLRNSKFHNPLKNFEEDSHILELRRDPLTGRMSILGKDMTDKSCILFGVKDQSLIQKIAEESQENCFLCPEKVMTATPTYPQDILAQERIVRGEATLFPNLFPLSEYHAVCTLTKTHYLNLSDFTPKLFSDGIQACLEFTKKAYEKNNTIKYMTINCNYLFPAGASAVHPHIQVLGGDIPYTLLNQMFERSKIYYEKNNSNYWQDLIGIEKEREERYIGRTGNIEWITPFAPVGTNEVQGIIFEKNNFLNMDQEDALSIGQGIAKILSFYEEEGWSTFNFAIYSGPLILNEKTEWFNCNIRIITRPNVYKNYRADDYFLQKLLGTEILVTSPESLATKLRLRFQDKPH
jgi:galactose-1-phosphate uridylyltransferase